jgi:chromosome segregation ATPase
MSNNVVSTAAEELKKWLDVLQQIIKEKQAYDAKQAAKIDKAEMRQLQEMRHEQMMAKFDKLANNGGDVNELKKAVEEAQKEIQSLRKQLEGPDELAVKAENLEKQQQENTEVEKQAEEKKAEVEKKAEEKKVEIDKKEQNVEQKHELKQPDNPGEVKLDAEKANHQFGLHRPNKEEAKLDPDNPKIQIGAHRKTGTDAGLSKNDAGKWKSALPSIKADGPKLNVLK